MKTKRKSLFNQSPAIPQMFYLRKVWVTVRVASGERLLKVMKPVYMFWSYRDSTPRIIDTTSRDIAKEAITTGKLAVKVKNKKVILDVCVPNPNADFFR
jgi:hypothetical protein